LDIDVTPFDNSGTKKEGVSRTYKGMDGYAPIFAYLGEEGTYRIIRLIGHIEHVGWMPCSSSSSICCRELFSPRSKPALK